MNMAPVQNNTKPLMDFFKVDIITAIIGAVGGILISFVSPVAPFLLMAFMLIVCDLYTGTAAAKKRNEKIHSRGIGRSIEKMVLYIIAILLAEMFRITFLNNTRITLVNEFPIVYIVAITISIRELKSNFENIEIVTGTNVWAVVNSKLSEILSILKDKNKTPKD